MESYSKTPTPPEQLADFPGLSQEDLDAVERRFTQYLFFENEKYGRQIWTTCCHRQEFINERGRTSTPGDRLVLSAKHNEYVTCKFCGRVVYAKNRRLLRRGVLISEYRAVLFLHVSEDGDTVWAQGYWATRDLMYDPAGPVLYKPTRVYRFQPGKAEQWDIYGSGNLYKRKHPKLQEPCVDDGNGYALYIPVGIQRLQNSFLRYTGVMEPLTLSGGGCKKKIWDEKGLRSDLIRCLAAAARYPKQFEMMRKADLTEPLGDLIWAWKKNADVIKWEETDPRKAFGLSTPELKEWLERDKSTDTLRVLKGVRKLGGRMSLTEAESLKNRLHMARITAIFREAKLYSIPINPLLRYLEGFAGSRCHGMGVTLDFVTRYWIDYIDMASQLGYDLSNPIWQMPRDLEEKHNQLAAVINAVKMSEKREAAKNRYQQAEKKYGFSMDGWVIRAPYNGAEIAAEGKTLRHCVGGYADRHMDGTLTILFLRRESDLNTPYVTIEMNGNRLVQIHGYMNEREACAVNPNRRPPKETHKKLLDIWLEWVSKGSKRNEDGTPILPKHKMKKAV